MRALKHVGRLTTKLDYVLLVCDVRGLPESCSSVAVCWERGGKIFTTRTIRVEGVGPERMARMNAKLKLTATLYRSPRKTTFDPKPSTLRVLNRSSSGSAAVLGQGELDLAGVASIDGVGRTQVRQLKLDPPGKVIQGALPITLQISISSKLADEDENTSTADSVSQASEIEDTSNRDSKRDMPLAPAPLSNPRLTQEVLTSFDESSESSTNSKLSVIKLLSGGASARAAHGQQVAARTAELSHALHEAQEEARQAEARVATLQHRLRTEVLAGVAEVLERSGKIRSKADLAEVYHRQLTLIMDQVERIAYDDGGAVGGAGGVSHLEAEVLQLRRDLAASRIECADLAGERDELMHVAKRLNKQLLEEASTARTK
mmetsp:Transcript_11660/g.25032  ORF Transcript_11660/g.25032 Transcript_11660/m.25032 type:complete len:375 (+) Transcript_11660:250-1374(+)